MKKILYTIIFLIAVSTAGLAESNPQKTEPNMPNFKLLLDKYAETQDKLRSFILEAENFTLASGSFDDGKIKDNNKKIFKHFDLRFDGNRTNIRINTWGDGDDITGPTTRDKSSYISNLWDGNSFSSYARDTRSERNDIGNLIIEKGDVRNLKNDMIPISYEGHELMGYFWGNYERVDSVLRKADTVSLRNNMERIGNSDCYVIEASLGNAEYTVWIDPNHGYNISKAQCKMGKNFAPYGRPQWKVKYAVCSLNNVKFKQINGIYVPIEADFTLEREWPNGDFAKVKQHHKITQIMVNPDHDALNSFVRDDVKNGAMVWIANAPGVIYTWQDGKVIDKDGKVIMDCITKNSGDNTKPQSKSASKEKSK